MAVRNFWVEADVDGYKTMLKGGQQQSRLTVLLTLKASLLPL